MFKMAVLKRRLGDVVVFLLLGFFLPMMVLQAFGDVIFPVYALFILVYITGVPLYRRMWSNDERKWWRFLLFMSWFYLAVCGGYLLFMGMAVLRLQ